ncbi:MAG: hypothetical protein J1G02_04735 [Clostridiales bacterium]|nr:hypothetical protein [Clostridiales bacterium]
MDKNEQNNMHHSCTINAEYQCANCGNMSHSKIQVTFDSLIDDATAYPTITCSHCGTSSLIHVPFIYWNRKTNEIYYVFPSRDLNNFQNTLRSLDLIYNDYKINLDIPTQKMLKTAQIRYVESGLFNATLNHKNDGNFALGLRNLRITPTLAVQTPDEFKFLSKEKKLPLQFNDVAYYATGISDSDKEFISDVENEIKRQSVSINIKPLIEEQSPSSTHGIMSLLFTIGSTILLPILIQVIGDVISHKITNKKISDRDELTVKIKENNSQNIYYFNGSPQAVLAAMEKCKKDTVTTVSIPGDCHVVTMIDNLVAEPHFKGIKTLDSAAKEYENHFDKHSALEFVNSDTVEEVIAAKAKFLMENGEYFRALAIMMPYMNTAKNIELMYNYALCLKCLGEEEQANELFVFIIKKYLQLPKLKDMELYLGNYTQMEIDKAGENIKNIVDGENDTKSRSQKAKEAEDFRRMVNSIYDFDLKRLCREADDNIEKIFHKKK